MIKNVSLVHILYNIIDDAIYADNKSAKFKFLTRIVMMVQSFPQQTRRVVICTFGIETLQS